MEVEHYLKRFETWCVDTLLLFTVLTIFLFGHLYLENRVRKNGPHSKRGHQKIEKWKRLSVDAPPASCPPCHYFCPKDLLTLIDASMTYVKQFVRESVHRQTDRRTDGQTDGTENITSTAGAGGKNVNYLWPSLLYTSWRNILLHLVEQEINGKKDHLQVIDATCFLLLPTMS